MCTLGDVGLCAPVVQDVGVGCGDIGAVVSPENDLSTGWEHLLQLEPPVHLKLAVGFDALGGHEGLDLWPEVPACA